MSLIGTKMKEKIKMKKQKENKQIITEQNIRNMFDVGNIQEIKIEEDCSLIFVYLDISPFKMDSYCAIDNLIYSVCCNCDYIRISMHRHKIEEAMEKWGHFK